jgi:hypothetical protein
MSTNNEDMTLQEAVDAVEQGRRNAAGVACLCCGQHCKEYKYKVSPKQAKQLAELAEYGVGKPVHYSEWAKLKTNSGGMLCILRHLGLIEQGKPDDKKPFNRSGKWSITDEGFNWVNGAIKIPVFVYVFDNIVQRFSEDKFSWEEAASASWKPKDYEKSKADTHEEAA